MTPTPKAQAVRTEVTEIHVLAYEREFVVPAVITIADDVVTCRLALALSEADEVLLASGSHDLVHAARDAFQTTLSPALRAGVERATGRTVRSHSSHTDLHTRTTVETFTLTPALPPG